MHRETRRVGWRRGAASGAAVKAFFKPLDLDEVRAVLGACAAVPPVCGAGGLHSTVQRRGGGGGADAPAPAQVVEYLFHNQLPGLNP
jgi:hypothetical protein